MTLFPQNILDALAANGRENAAHIDRDGNTVDHPPVVKIFNPYGGATWLLSESDPDEPDRLFGLCDLGMGEPELGYVLRSELEEIHIQIGAHALPLERDLHFTAKHPLSWYAEQARIERRIVD